MTKEQKIEELKKYFNIAREYLELQRDYKSKVYGIQAQKVSGMPIAHNVSDVMSGKISKMEVLDDFVNDRLKKLDNEKYKIEYAISKLEESIERRILRMRYINGFKFEKIAYITNYNWRTIYKIHDRAIDNIVFE